MRERTSGSGYATAIRGDRVERIGTTRAAFGMSENTNYVKSLRDAAVSPPARRRREQRQADAILLASSTRATETTSFPFRRGPFRKDSMLKMIRVPRALLSVVFLMLVLAESASAFTVNWVAVGFEGKNVMTSSLADSAQSTISTGSRRPK